MGYIYKTTNLINQKKYIGKTNGNSDSYLGSGVLIKQAIQKYGAENFKKEILFESDSEEELREKEKYYIEKEMAVERSDYYNMHEGGQGGFIPKTKGSMSAPIQKYWDSLTEEQKKERCKNVGKYNKKGSKNPKARKALVNGKEYNCLKDALADYPNVPYSTLKGIAQTESYSEAHKIKAKYI